MPRIRLDYKHFLNILKGRGVKNVKMTPALKQYLGSDAETPTEKAFEELFEDAYSKCQTPLTYSFNSYVSEYFKVWSTHVNGETKLSRLQKFNLSINAELASHGTCYTPDVSKQKIDSFNKVYNTSGIKDLFNDSQAFFQYVAKTFFGTDISTCRKV